MALQQVPDIGVNACWVARQQRSAVQNRAATDRVESVWMLLAMALTAAGGHLAFLQ